MNDNFWENVSRYPRYLLTFTLGIFFSIFGWLKPLLEKPVTAIALVAFLAASSCFIVLTLRAMLGLNAV
ncbi:MAG: DUF751 family protein [Oscillatoria sp. SIO1A7]|nr:DUF751 family protein [Oscillatoria sp. SIO1A7]